VDGDPATNKHFLNARQTFLDPKDLQDEDRYAASWWMTRERFMRVNVSDIGNLEGASFVPLSPLHGEEEDVVRMTRDWLDFSVEHLSKWQQMIGTREGNAHAEAACRRYVDNRKDKLVDSYMASTLAVIPFGVPDGTDESTQKVWVAYLAATIASLVKHATKRVVVVGYFEMDAKLAGRALELLLPAKDKACAMYSDNLTSCDFFHHQTEISFLWTTNIATEFLDTNVPFGALMALQKELRKTTEEDTSEVTGSFCGKSHRASDFSFIYFTEPDQILHARLAPAFLREMQDGGVIVPHRLQPIPHLQELRHFSDLDTEYAFLPGDNDHAPVIPLHHSMETDACCDTTEHYGLRTCDNFWWMCGYSSGNFSYFQPFDFMRLFDGGTGIVSLAGNEHGRMCRVQPHGRGRCHSD
jgi:hypothetical protein